MEYARGEGKAKGKAEIVRNLVIKFGFNDQQAADPAEVSIDFVKKIRTSIKKRE